MRWLKRKLTKKSAFQDILPYTYEARINVADEDFEYYSYYSDTICNLVDYLDQHDFHPEQVTFFEIYHNQKVLLTHRLFSEDKLWLQKSALCDLFNNYYMGHIKKGKCIFQKRDVSTRGPQKFRRKSGDISI